MPLHILECQAFLCFCCCFSPGGGGDYGIARDITTTVPVSLGFPFAIPWRVISRIVRNIDKFVGFKIKLQNKLSFVCNKQRIYGNILYINTAVLALLLLEKVYRFSHYSCFQLNKFKVLELACIGSCFALSLFSNSVIRWYNTPQLWLAEYESFPLGKVCIGHGVREILHLDRIHMASEDLFRDFAIDVVYLEYVSFSAGGEIWWMDLRAENAGGLKYGW